MGLEGLPALSQLLLCAESNQGIRIMEEESQNIWLLISDKLIENFIHVFDRWTI
jgi:hypothetical protein